MATNYGLNDSLKYNEFVFDSLSALNPYDSQYQASDWPSFNIGQISNVAAIKVLEVQLPFSFYIINKHNNTFYIIENVLASEFIEKIVMPVGNYTIDYLKLALASALTSASQANSTGFTYTVDYDTATMKLTIQGSNFYDTAYFRLSMTGDTNLNTLIYHDSVDPDTGRPRGFNTNFNKVYAENEITNPGLWFGFSSSANYQSTTGTSPKLVSPNVFNISGPDYIYICSRALGPEVKMLLPGNGSSGNSGGADGPQIAKIPVLVNSGDIIFWTDPDPQKYFDANNLNALTTLDIYCTIGMDSESVPVEFNGLGFSVKLGILTYETTHNTNLGGGRANDRVVSKTWRT